MKFSRFITYTTLIFCFLIISACAVNPVTGKKQLVLMSEQQEISMGVAADPQIVGFFGLYDDVKLQNFITEKGKQMAAVSHRPNLAYEFKIVDSPAINAFAVPGGYVYFTRGIMAHFNNEAEFAGVLGHEIGHITARHTVIQQRNAMLGQIGLIAGIVLVPRLAEFAEPLTTGMQLALMSFGRDAERQSDELGVEYSARIGYDPTEMAGFFTTLERQSAKEGNPAIPEFLSTHPSPGDRFVTVGKLAEEWKTKLNLANPKVGRDNYLRMIDGIILGENPRQGFVENSMFYHPDLKFLFSIPQNWKLINTPQQVQMAPANGEALFMFTIVQGNSLEEAANSILQNYKLERVDAQKETINGLPALVMIADQKQEKGTIRVLNGLIQYGGNIYSFMGISELSKFNGYQNTFLTTIRNFAELKEASKLNKKPERVRIKTLTQDMTLQAALRFYNMPTARYDELAILNGMLLTDQLKKGSLIKMVGE